MPYNAQWESQIAGYRRNSRLLLARNISFRVRQPAVEAGIRATLTQPGSVTFLWPPYTGRDFGPTRHQGWVMLAFDERSDARRAELEFQNLVLDGRPVEVKRASRQAYLPRAQAAASASITTTPVPTAPAATAPVTTAPVTSSLVTSAPTIISLATTAVNVTNTAVTSTVAAAAATTITLAAAPPTAGTLGFYRNDYSTNVDDESDNNSEIVWEDDD